MDHTCQNSMQFPAAYAVIVEEEMIYIEGGSYTFVVGDYQITSPISPDQVATFCTNAVINYIRLLGQTAFSNTVNGLQAAKADGIKPSAAIRYFWNNQGTLGRAATFVFAGFAGYYLYVQAVNLYYMFSSIYNDLKNAYEQSMNPSTVTLSAA